MLGKLRKGLGARADGPFAHALEIGAGTGYFSLNLMRAGIVERATCLDISPGMLETLERNAATLGLADRVDTVATDAEQLPFDDDSFDLVLGHAVLHHLPDLDRRSASSTACCARRHALLRRRAVAARRPHRAYPKRAALRAAPAWRRLIGAQQAAEHAHVHTREHSDGHDLEQFVDVHAFDPASLTAFAEGAGFDDVRVRGEELLANWFGWTNRTLEASAVPETVPMLWRQYAYRGYIALQAVDRVAARAAAAAGDLLQPDRQRSEADPGAA